MPQNNDRKERDFSQYDAMSTEGLSEILRLDSETPEGNGLDIDTLLYITGVLAERQKSTNTGKTAQEAWKSFQQNYLDSEEECPVAAVETKSTKAKNPWIRRIIAAAAILALMVSVPLTAKALNWDDICTAVVQWAKETFSFVRGDQRNIDGPNVGDTREYDSLQQALELTGQDFNSIPTWIPDGYILDKIDINRTPAQKDYNALYVKDGQLFNISVCFFIDTDPPKMEANQNIAETYIVNGDEYFIVTNNERIGAMWTQDSYECYITGDLTVDELKLMINSIPEG